MLSRYLFFLVFFLTPYLLSASVVNIAAAANLSYLIPELKTAFMQTHPNAELRFTIGGSGKLAIQIERGAGYDLFLSADTNYPLKLYRKGNTLEKPKVYAKGALVLLSAKKRDFSRGMHLLTQSAIKRIAIANPKTAPYGKASLQALKQSGIYEAIKQKIVYAESISQTLVYTLRAADIGIVAKSSLFAPSLHNLKKGENWEDVGTDLYSPISQSAALLRHAKGNEDAKAFYNFLFGSVAQTIFKKYGYKVS